MALENKLGITDSTELAKAEERISKTKALDGGWQHSGNCSGDRVSCGTAAPGTRPASKP